MRLSPARPARLLAALAALLFCAPAFAHQQSISYGDYQVHGSTLDVRLRFAAADLLPLVPPGAQPGQERGEKLTQASLLRLGPALQAATLGAVRVRSSGEACAPSALWTATLQEPDGVVIAGAFSCPQPIVQLELRLGFLESLSPGHTSLSLVGFENQPAAERVAQAGSETFVVEHAPALGATLRRFLLLGIEHIFTGYDHIAFLIGLLLLGGSLRALFGIVSAFTVAHSITLGLATLDLVAPPPQVIEPLIALSIIYVAVENLWALRSAAGSPRALSALRHRWMITFAFGLVHGFGFASALRELHLPRAGLAATLVTFNLGVEAGQLCIVALAYPALRALHRRPGLQTRTSVVLSSVIGLLGLFWFGQRILS